MVDCCLIKLIHYLSYGNLNPFNSPSARSWCLAIGVLALWGLVWMRLQLEWRMNPNYAFGWAVPIMTVFLWMRRARDVVEVRLSGSCSVDEGVRRRRAWMSGFLVLLLLMMLLPLRIISEANPVWRGSQWALAGSAWIASLALLMMFRGASGLRAFFPVCTFPFVAVPLIFDWETTIILFLSKWNTLCSADILQYLGIPAVASGTILRVGATSLNIQEACSGIRSLHLAIAIAFFWCVLYRLSWKAWITVAVSSISIAFVFNILRNTTLAFLVNSGGEQAFDAYHEIAGWCAQLAVVATIWAVVSCFQGHHRTRPVRIASYENHDDSSSSTATAMPNAVLPALSISILLWIAMIEAGTEWWFLRNEKPDAGIARDWTITPDADLNKNHFIAKGLDKETALSLRVDEARVLTWSNAEGHRRELYFLRWSREHTSKYGVLIHSPETCLTAVGMKLVKPGVPVEFQIRNGGDSFELPFAVSEFIQNERPVTVFFCIWDDRSGAVQTSASSPLAYGARLSAAWRGERQTGQQILEVAMWGANRESAETEFKALLPTIIRGSDSSLRH